MTQGFLMTTTTQTQSNRRSWAKAIAQPPQEFPLTPLPILSGHIPPGLQGSLYRNGAARLERGGEKVGHWFDGDGAILAVHFNEGKATGTYRYVKTEGYLAESKAGKFLYTNYGMKENGPIWKAWLRLIKNNMIAKNSANTSVLALPDKLLALWEGGWPYALDLENLETIGLDNLGGLDAPQPYSAHPLVDPNTQEIFNIGVSAGAKITLNLYRSDRTGKILQKGAVDLKNLPFLHSFSMAGRYLIFFLSPVKVNMLPLFLGMTTYADAVQWQPEQGTQILVIDRETFEVISRSETEPFFQWHFGNGCVEPDGQVRLDLAKYADVIQTNEYLREVPTGETHTVSKATLCQVRLNPQTGKVLAMETVVDQCCEFPIVPPAQVGQPWRHTYLNILRPQTELGKEMFDSIARFDYQTGTLTQADLGKNRYPAEPIYVADAMDRDRGWILTVVYDGNTHNSEVWIYDSDRLNDEPVGRLGLPEVIPMSYHGTWKQASL